MDFSGHRVGSLVSLVQLRGWWDTQQQLLLCAHTPAAHSRLWQLPLPPAIPFSKPTHQPPQAAELPTHSSTAPSPQHPHTPKNPLVLLNPGVFPT